VLLVHYDIVIYSNAFGVHNYTDNIIMSVMDFALFALTTGNSVDELADTKNDEVGDKLAEFGKCQERKAEPQTEHSAEI